MGRGRVGRGRVCGTRPLPEPRGIAGVGAPRSGGGACLGKTADTVVKAENSLVSVVVGLSGENFGNLDLTLANLTECRLNARLLYLKLVLVGDVAKIASAALCKVRAVGLLSVGGGLVN